MSEKLEAILRQGRPDDQTPEVEENPFYQLSRTGGEKEEFLELRLNNGVITLLRYEEVSWFNYDPSTGWLTGHFATVFMGIRGRGLAPQLLNAIKARKVAWVREADTDFEDRPELEIFIEEISVGPVEGDAETDADFDEESETDEEAA